MKWIAALTLLLLSAVVTAIALRQSLFSDYSRDFGALSPAQFQAMNARMDRLSAVARVAYCALAAADLALIVVAARARAFLVCGLATVLAVGLALFLLVSLASVGPTLVGAVPSPRRHADERVNSLQARTSSVWRASAGA